MRGISCKGEIYLFDYRCTVPHTGAKCGKENFFRIVPIDDRTLAPVEIIIFKLLPILTIVVGTIGRSIKCIAIETSLMIWIYGNIIYILIFIKNGSPRFTVVLRQENSSLRLQRCVATRSPGYSTTNQIAQ